MGANRSSSFVRILELFCEDQVRERDYPKLCVNLLCGVE